MTEANNSEISGADDNACCDWYPIWLKNLVKKCGTDNTYTGKKFSVGLDEKLAIACYIADNLETSVFFEAGSTLRVVAGAAFHLASQNHMSLIAATNNLDISEDFLAGRFDSSGSDVTLHLTGGKHDRNHHALFGEIAATTLTNIFPESIIIGCSGFTFTEGLFYHGGTEEGLVKSALYSKEVDRRILALDHTKLGTRDMFLCKNDGGDDIRGLCKKVRDKTLIVTSAPPESVEKRKLRTTGVTNWNREIGYLEGKNPVGQSDDSIKKVETVQRWLKEQCLQVVVVTPEESEPYYRVTQVFPSQSK